MAFTLAEAFVDLGTRDKGLTAGLAAAKSSLKSLQPAFDAIRTSAKTIFFGLTAAAGLFAKAASESEDATLALKLAVGDAAEELGNFATSLQYITVYEDDAIKASMAMAANLGVTADQMKAVTTAGIGLASRLFGGNLEAGIEAVAKATQGNTRALDKLIPGLKDAGTAAEKMAIIQAYAAKGFQDAQAKTQTLSGTMKQLWNQVGDTAEEFGGILLPYVKKAVSLFETLAIALKKLTPAQRDNIVKWAAITAAISGLIVFGPSLMAFFSAAVSGLVIVSKAALALGQVLIGLVLSPFGLVIAGVAGIVTAFAWLVGSGDTTSKRIIDGFLEIVKFFDVMLGSWKGFTDSFKLLWSQSGFYLLESFYVIKGYLLNGWEYLAQGIEQAWWYAFEGMYGAWNYLQSGCQKFINWFKNAWQNIINYVADLFSGWIIEADMKMDERKIREKGQKQGKNESQIQRDIDEERKFREAKQRGSRDSKQASEYSKKQKAVDDEYKFTQDQMGKQMRDAREQDRAKRQKNRAENDAKGQADIDAVEQARQQDLAERMKGLSQLPKLSDKAVEFADALKKGVGLEDLLKMAKDITELGRSLEANAKSAKDKAKGDTENTGELTGKEGKSKKAKGETISRTDIGETFKHLSAMRLLGRQAANDPANVAKSQLEQTKKQTELLQKNNDYLKQMREAYNFTPKWG